MRDCATGRVLISKPPQRVSSPHLMDDLHDDTPQFDSDDDELDWEEVYIPSQPQAGPSATATPDVNIPVAPAIPTIEITLESRKAKKDKDDAL
jgi:hypothetical protein